MVSLAWPRAARIVLARLSSELSTSVLSSSLQVGRGVCADRFKFQSLQGANSAVRRHLLVVSPGSFPVCLFVLCASPVLLVACCRRCRRGLLYFCEGLRESRNEPRMVRGARARDELTAGPGVCGDCGVCCLGPSHICPLGNMEVVIAVASQIPVPAAMTCQFSPVALPGAHELTSS